MQANRTAQIIFACGAPGSGKSHFLRAELQRRAPDRLLVIDPDGEYDGAGYLHDNLAEFYRATGFAAFRSRFRPAAARAEGEHQFDLVCRMVRWHTDPRPGQAPPPRTAPVTFLVDELADYIGPSFREAPESWQWIIRRGRKYGVTVLAASQRPAQIDKTLFDCASSIRTGRLNNSESQRVIAAALDVPIAQLRALTGHQFIELDKNTGKRRKG